MQRNTSLAVACALALNTFAAFSAAHAATPAIASSSAAGTTLTINGSNLSGGTATVTVGNSAPLAITAQSATQLSATLPVGLAAGAYSLYVQIGGSRSNSATSLAVLGAVGPAGPAGAQGATGPAGAQGATGASGAQGAAGPAGATGSVGPQGLAGPAGATGPQGAAGAQGPMGPEGWPGAPGATGATGAGAQMLVDANGSLVGPVYGAPQSETGAGYVLATVGYDRVAIPFTFGFIDINGQIQGPDLTLGGGAGYLGYTGPGCSGYAYLVGGWLPGATRSSAVYNDGYGNHYKIYLAAGGYSARVTIASALVQPADSRAWSYPVCQDMTATNVIGYDAQQYPQYLNFTYPFHLQ